MKQESDRNRDIPKTPEELDAKLGVLMNEFGLGQGVLDSFLIEHPEVTILAAKKQFYRILTSLKEEKEPNSE